jgi:hypothetical protein
MTLRESSTVGNCRRLGKKFNGSLVASERLSALSLWAFAPFQYFLMHYVGFDTNQ